MHVHVYEIFVGILSVGIMAKLSTHNSCTFFCTYMYSAYIRLLTLV